MAEIETYKGRFMPEMRVFLSELQRNPIQASPSQYLKDRGLGKSRLIGLLLKYGIVERNEKIGGDVKKGEEPTYSVSYKIPRKNFQRKMDRLYSRLFEKNLPPTKEHDINECGDCASVGGAFVAPLNTTPIRRSMIVTEAQFKMINDVINDVTRGDIEEAAATTNIGALGDYTANGLVLRTSDGKKDPAYER